ncbi:MAPEG family protein [Aliishimia ponticola]|uniref:MAPEG family protein n=1 Tax=Aliishimia ponticola TaxID=2499833 RepID=A0A4S4NIW9_9RHOB|nr:MAPEG family protein [Aliishimia ponticola]THH36040.1 MAPEG family protein [Aliishimia ponticola]
MTPELTVLTLAGLLQVLQFILYSATAQRAVGKTYALSPRDTPRELSGTAGRAQRAMNNHYEALILFGIAALVIGVSGQSTGFTATCAWVYLIARVLYVPAYLLGWVPWRSLIWMVGLGATILMLIAALI